MPIVSKRSVHVTGIALSIALAASCGKKDGSSPASNTDPATQSGGQNGTTPTTTTNTGATNQESKDSLASFAIAGKINLATALRLDGEEIKVTDVVALDPSSGAAVTATVDADGSFKLSLEPDKPWVISYVDSTKTGADMIVSTSASGTLDTLTASADATSADLGAVDVSTPKATMSTSREDFLKSIGMTEGAAETLGGLDDVSLRYSNPDIDNNGVIDATENKKYLIDFHNRFTAKKADGSQLSMADQKNAFFPNDAVFTYNGTGIMPMIPKTDFASNPATYSWKFSVAMPVAGNGGAICDGMHAGDSITAGTACNLTHTNDVGGNSDSQYVFNLETAALKAGDYTLKVGDKTYFWKNVAVSDFSSGDGFLALFIRYDVSDANKLTGISYKWQKKGSDGKYALATEEEVKLIVKASESAAGYISLHYKGNPGLGGFGLSVPTKAEGSVVLADDLAQASPTVSFGGSVTKEMIVNGIDWDDLTAGGAGVSYDDKLGMRFFF